MGERVVFGLKYVAALAAVVALMGTLAWLLTAMLVAAGWGMCLVLGIR
jgi:hypothetical protein